MTDATTTAPSRRKGRSPSYPGINLETAVQRARQLYAQERQHATSVGTITQHWGYKSLNGPGAVTLAALKKFGLITDEGTGPDRRASVTDLAVEILENPSVEARKTAIQRAALNPSIHRDLWEKYGPSLPSDLNLRWELTRDRGFTETGAAEFIPEYRDTLAYAQLGQDGGTLAVHREQEQQREDGVGQDELGDQTPAPTPAQNQHPARTPRKVSDTATAYSIPLPRGAGAVLLEADFPLSEAQWEYFMSLLNAMKAGLVDEVRQEDGG